MTSPLRVAANAAAALALSGCVATSDGGMANRLNRDGDAVATLAPKLRPGQNVDLKSDVAGLRLMSDKVERNLRTSGNIVRDPAINQYVQSLVCKLAGPYCGDIRVYVVRAPYFNATMMANGSLQVWTGLLLRTQNEAQLAAVLGHEIGHYLREHTIERMRRVVNTSNVLAFVQLALAGAGVGIVGSVASLVAVAQLTAYSRDQEREADHYGHQIIVEHGYDPRQAARVWDQLISEKDTDDDEEDEEPKSLFLSSHPLPIERSQNLTEMAELADPNAKLTKTGAARFNAVMLPHRLSFMWDELHLRRYDRFERLLELVGKSGLKIGELKFFNGELHRLRNKEGDIDTAREHFEQALKDGGAPVEIYRSLGQVHRKLGNEAESVAAFKKYLELNPAAKDAKMIRYMLGATS